MKTLFLLSTSLFISISAFAASFEQPVADRESAAEILQDQWVVASLADYPAIQTYGVTTCIVVSIYDPDTNLGAMMHVSASTRVDEAMNDVRAELRSRGSNLRHLHAELRGGWGDSMDQTGMHFESARMVEDILAQMDKRRIKVTLDDTVTEMSEVNVGKFPIIAVEMDLRTGSTHLYTETVRGPQAGQPMAINEP